MTNALSAYLAGRAAAIAEISAGITTSKHFTDARREHLATRSAAGLFDFSFMGCYEIGGSDSRPFLRVVQTRALQTLAVGRVAYTLMLRDDGSVLNDATVWRLARDRYWLFSGQRSDFASVSAMASPYAVTVTDVSSQHSVIADRVRAVTRLLRAALTRLDCHHFPIMDFAKFVSTGSSAGWRESGTVANQATSW